MEAHFNKDAGEPGRGDFHRFVLLFGHSFSNRIKFWSEFELEHAIVEGGEEKGEVALEQAYLDFLVKPWLNFRGGMLLSPVGIINERHEPPSFNGVERPFVETLIIPSTWRELGAGTDRRPRPRLPISRLHGLGIGPDADSAPRKGSPGEERRDSGRLFVIRLRSRGWSTPASAA